MKIIYSFGKYNKIIEHMGNIYFTVKINKEIQYMKIIKEKIRKEVAND